MEEIPEALKPSIELSKSNEKIQIYKGEFILKNEHHEIKIFGEIFYDWFPKTGTKFDGKILEKSENYKYLVWEYNDYNIIIDGLNTGIAWIKEEKSLLDGIYLKGIYRNEMFLGDKSQKTQKVLFSIINLKNYFGEVIHYNLKNGGWSRSHSRIFLKNKNCDIIIDRLYDYEKKIEELKSTGGYNILQTGKLNFYKPVSYLEIKETISCLSYFLSFLSGFKTSPVFLKAKHNEDLLYQDFSNYETPMFSESINWSYYVKDKQIKMLFFEFSNLWKKDKNSKQFLQMVIDWYCLVNSNKAYLEGSIIIAQTALEL